MAEDHSSQTPDTEVTVLSDVRPEDFPQIWYEIADEGHFWCKWRLAAFLHQMRELEVPLGEPLKGFEIGCGNGVVRRQLEKVTPWEIDGADIDAAALEANHTARGTSYLYDVHDRHNDLREKYDFIILFDIIEHIPDEETNAFLESCLFHLKPGGTFFLNVPSLRCLWSKYDTFAGHLRRYTKPTMRSQLEAVGLEVNDLRYWGLSLTPVALARKFLLRGTTSADSAITTGFKPASPLLNSLFCGMLKLETGLLRSPFAGTSLLAAARRRS